jgi:Na+-transporting NADH:ubiquinone oxidoreductase subunit NqrA
VKKLASTHVFTQYIEIFQANVSKNFCSQTAFIKASFHIQVALNNQNNTQFENSSNHFFQIISPIPSFSKSIHIHAIAHHSTLKNSYIQAL